jgi:hypothetical protein
LHEQDVGGLRDGFLPKLVRSAPLVKVGPGLAPLQLLVSRREMPECQGDEGRPVRPSQCEHLESPLVLVLPLLRMVVDFRDEF